MKTYIIAFVLCLIFLGTYSDSIMANPQDTRFPERSVTIGANKYSYRIYVPENYDAKKEYPAILYLHGSDERGVDNKAQIATGLPEVIATGLGKRSKVFSEFIGIFPQCGENKFWVGESADQAMKAMEQTIAEFNVNRERVYLTGFSMGGYGTWYLAAKYQNTFAAIVPIGGHIVPAFLTVPMTMPPMLKDMMHPDMLPLYESADPYASFAKANGGTPVWIFHGEKDDQVPVADAQNMFKAAKIIDSEAKYTEYEGEKHFVYEKAYSGEGFWEWLFSKQLSAKKIHGQKM